MSTALHSRLLCASVCAYSVQPNSTIAAVPPYDAVLGVTAPSVAFAAGAHNINACVVSTNADGVILSFRGTLPPLSPDHRQTVLDWFNNFHAELISVPRIPGRVHEGFWRAIDSIWAPLEKEVTDRLKALG